MQIDRYEGNYDKPLFYSKMGHFFAEEKYIRQMPYLRNEADRIWFVIERSGIVIAFSSLRIKDTHILLTTEYVESGYRRKGLFHALTVIRLNYCKGMSLPIRTSTNLEYIKAYYEKQGFYIYRTTKNYWFLSKEPAVDWEAKYQDGYKSNRRGKVSGTR